MNYAELTTEQLQEIIQLANNELAKRELEKSNVYLPIIKIGKECYQTQKGDYIYDNGSAIQFIAGDNRNLKYTKKDYYTSIRLTKKAESQIDYLKLKIVATRSGRKWYF